MIENKNNSNYNITTTGSSYRSISPLELVFIILGCICFIIFISNSSLIRYLPIFIISLIIITVISLKNYHLLLMVYIFMTPLEGFLSVNKISILRYFSPLIFILWLIRSILSRQSIRFKNSMILFILWFLWGLFSLLWAHNANLGWSSYAISLFNILPMFVVIISEVNSYNKLKQLTITLGISSLILTLFVYLRGDLLTIPGAMLVQSISDKVIGVTITTPVAIALILFTTTSIFGHGLFKMIGMIISIFCLFVLISTGERGPVLYSLASLACITVPFQLGHEKIFTRISIIVIVTVSLIFIMEKNVLPEASTNRFKKTEMFSKNGTMQQRLIAYNIGITKWKTSPLTGIGLGNYSLIPALKRIDAHSDYVRVLVETGIVGALLFVLAVLLVLRVSIKCFLKSNKSNQLLSGIIFALTLFVVLSSISNSIFLLRSYWVIFALAIASEESINVFN
jgi:O-antigen ligase